MKNNYFTKVENKYVFNLSLIFWHVLITLATLAIVVSLMALLWGAIPVFHKKVVKEPYPEKKEYPAPIKVAFTELKMTDLSKVELPKIDIEMAVPQPKEQQPLEDLTGKVEYDALLDTLKILIPPTKYPWEGKGAWVYPQGERYWIVYRREEYRRWISTEGGIIEKLTASYRKANAKTYIEKKQLLDGYISLVRQLPESIRLGALETLTNNVADNVQQNNDILMSMVKVVRKIDIVENSSVIGLLSAFGKNNPSDGIPFIDYAATIIDKVDKTQQLDFIVNMRFAFYSSFNQDLNIQKEATDLYVSMLSQIPSNQQVQALNQYYNLYIDKNRKRNDQIRQIDFDYQKSIDLIDSQFELAQQQAQMEFEAKKTSKERLRLKALSGIGGGVLLIVLIATFLAFLSIQRSVRKMEEQLLHPKD